jgi:protein gp37
MRLEYCEEHIDDVAEACGLADKTVKDVKVGNSRRKKIKEQFPELSEEISSISTDAVTELGKKDNLELLEKAIPILKEKMKGDKRLTKKEVVAILNQVREEIEKDRIAATVFPPAEPPIVETPQPVTEPEPVESQSTSSSETTPTVVPTIFVANPTSNGQVDITGQPVVIPPPVSTAKFNQTNDNIEWARWSWNPVTGCKYGCKYCYARDIANRFNADGFEPTFHPERLCMVNNTKVPSGDDIGEHNVFVCSMADLFGEWVPKEWIDAILEVIKAGDPRWNYLFLTKNPKRLPSIDFPKNAWVGTTVDTQARVAAAEKAFKKIKNVAVKFVSIEPMMEPIIFENIGVFDWVIIGGRSENSAMSTGYRDDKEHRDLGQPEWDWVESVLLQARNAGVKVYFKPNLTVRPKEYPTLK